MLYSCMWCYVGRHTESAHVRVRAFVRVYRCMHRHRISMEGIQGERMSKHAVRCCLLACRRKS